MKKLTLLSFLFLILGSFFVCVNSVQAKDITEDTVVKSGEVMTITDGEFLTVYPGATLTVEGGGVVKLGTNSVIELFGNLVAAGSDGNPAIFTSLKDDSVGGDSDGNNGDAAPGDWWGIASGEPEAQIRLDYAQVKYGGGQYGSEAPIIAVNQAKVVRINHSEIVNNKGMMFFGEIGDLAINNSNIYNPDYCQEYEGQSYCGIFAIAYYGSGQADFTNNYWGHMDGPSSAGTMFMGNSPGIIYQPFSDKPFVFKASVKKPNPVILIPGIMGSWSVSGKLELDPFLNTYDNLWQALKAAGYEEGKTLFAFPYVWQDSNVSNTDDLMRKIQEVKEIAGSDKVDLIGHSMGGLLARSYIESIYYKDDVDKLVFLATPHLGATKAYLMWEGGELGQGWKDLADEFILELYANHNGHDSIYGYIRGDVPSVRDLLPIYDYLKEASTSEFRSYPNSYPQNIFLDYLNKPENIAKLRDVDIFNIVADDRKNDTLNYIRVTSKDFEDGRWEDGYPENYYGLFGDHGLEFGFGDGTVPQISNNNLFGHELNINGTNHGDVVTDAQLDVIEFLTGKRPMQTFKNNFVQKSLMIRIFSPADFSITSPDGKKLGRQADGSTANEIIGAKYYNEDGIEFAMIPDPLSGDYRVDLIGTGDGEYRLSSAIISDATSTEKSYSGTISIGQAQVLDFTYSSSSDDLTAPAPEDKDAPIITISSSPAYFHSASLSIIASTTGITTTSSTVENKIRPAIHKSANIYYNIYDASAISSTQVYIDDSLVSSAPSVTLTVNFFKLSLGGHVFKIVSVDSHGNSSTATSTFEVIADIRSSIIDVRTVFKNKWLTDDQKKKEIIGIYRDLRRDIISTDSEINKARKMIEQIESNPKLNPKEKQKRIDEQNKIIGKAQAKIADVKLKALRKVDDLLDKLVSKRKLNQAGYDIMKANNDYLKNNL